MLPVASVDPVPITDVFRTMVLFAIWAEVVGVPVAWLRVRKLEAWQERPKEEGAIRLLSVYVAKITLMVFLWAGLVGSCAAIGSRL